MLKYFVSRILLLIPMLLVIGLVVFIGLELAPGDPITAMIPPDPVIFYDLGGYRGYERKSGIK
jgi:ABC-type dipeptide/oligopeptide/nickel transport system permease component